MSTDALLEGSFAAALARLDYAAGIAAAGHLQGLGCRDVDVMNESEADDMCRIIISRNYPGLAEVDLALLVAEHRMLKTRCWPSKHSKQYEDGKLEVRVRQLVHQYPLCSPEYLICLVGSGCYNDYGEIIHTVTHVTSGAPWIPPTVPPPPSPGVPTDACVACHLSDSSAAMNTAPTPLARELGVPSMLAVDAGSGGLPV